MSTLLSGDWRERKKKKGQRKSDKREKEKKAKEGESEGEGVRQTEDSRGGRMSRQIDKQIEEDTGHPEADSGI